MLLLTIMNKKITSVQLPDWVYDRLQEHKERTGQSASELLRILLVEMFEPEVNEDFRKKVKKCVDNSKLLIENIKKKE